MTLIVGMHYNNKKGALIASDSRGVSGYDLIPNVQKIFQIYNVTFAFTGTIYIRDELLREFEKTLKNANETEGITKSIQQAYINKRGWYTGGEYPLLDKAKKFSCRGLAGFYSNGSKLFNINDKGIMEESIGPQSEGQKSEYALEMLKDLYWEGMSKEQAINSAVYVINEVSKRNSGVDNQVQIATIEKEGSRILNNINGHFDFDQFSTLVEDLDSNHLAESQRLTLHILLNGQSKYRSRLENLLSKVKIEGKNPF